MKTTKIFTAAFILLSFVATSFGQKMAANQKTFKKEVFDQTLNNAVKPNVVGYQYVLIKDGKIVVENAGGLARRASDNGGTELKMTTSTPSLIGSLTKFLSGTAMINMMEKENPYAIDKGKTLSQKLDRKFVTMIPNVWSNNILAGAKNVTFRQLLQHRSGFNDKKPENRTVLGFLHDPDGYNYFMTDKRDYSNINFVLNGYLLALYERPDRAEGLNMDIAFNKFNEAQGDKFARDTLGKWMHQSMKTRIWDKMSPKILPSCDAANALKNTAAYTYGSKADTKGTIKNTLETNGHCVGQGAYYMSSRDLANYMAHFNASELIVSKQARELMFNDSMSNPDDRLVWALSNGDSWMKTNFNVPNIAWSNGIEDGARTVLVRLPDNYYLVLFANSADMEVGDLYKAGVNAFKEGMKHNF